MRRSFIEINPEFEKALHVMEETTGTYYHG